MQQVLLGRTSSFKSASSALTMLFVVDDENSLGDDQDFITEMENRGHTVDTITDSDVTGSEGLGYDVFVISDSVNTGSFNTEWKDTTLGVVNLKRSTWDNNNYTNNGFGDSGETVWDISDDTHPILSYWSYTTPAIGFPCYTSSGTYGYVNNTNEGSAVMNIDGGGTNANLFVMEVDDVGQNSDTMEGRRVAFGPYEFPKFEDETWDILESSLLWAAGII